MRISDCISDVCSSDLRQQIRARMADLVEHLCEHGMNRHAATGACRLGDDKAAIGFNLDDRKTHVGIAVADRLPVREVAAGALRAAFDDVTGQRAGGELVVVVRSEEHTSELQSLMRISYAVFCLKKKKQTNKNTIK